MIAKAKEQNANKPLLEDQEWEDLLPFLKVGACRAKVTGIMRNNAYGKLFDAVKENLLPFKFTEDECQSIAVAEEWTGMCKAHSPMGYRNYIVNKSSGIAKMTNRNQ